jgi:hypothetical protein
MYILRELYPFDVGALLFEDSDDYIGQRVVPARQMDPAQEEELPYFA